MKKIILAYFVLIGITTSGRAQDVFEATNTGNIKRLAQLVDMKKDTIEVKDQTGLTPLMLACIAHQNNTAQFLIDHGADVNVYSPAGTALILAAKDNNYELVQAIVVNEGKLDMQAADGNTALIYAVINQNYEMVSFLLRSGANKNLSNLIGNTPMSTARALGNKQIMALLMEK